MNQPLRLLGSYVRAARSAAKQARAISYRHPKRPDHPVEREQRFRQPDKFVVSHRWREHPADEVPGSRARTLNRAELNVPGTESSRPCASPLNSCLATLPARAATSVCRTRMRIDLRRRGDGPCAACNRSDGDARRGHCTRQPPDVSDKHQRQGRLEWARRPAASSRPIRRTSSAVR